MIIWSGLGFLVAIIAFACLFMSELFVENAFHDDQYYQTHGWPKLVAMLVAAGLVWLLGNYLNKKQGKRLVDPATGKDVVLKPNHSLFFIRMEYWAAILLVLGIALAIFAQ
jgi:hypothetical protein